MFVTCVLSVFLVSTEQSDAHESEMRDIRPNDGGMTITTIAAHTA
jgi:hypothetical protein